jgi:CBS domain
MVKGPPGERDVLLRQWKVRTLGNGGARAEVPVVHCPVKVGVERVGDCLECARLKGEVTLGGHRYLECTVPEGVVEPAGVCGELVAGDATALETDLCARDALRVLEASAAASVLVVDDNSVPVGQVFASGLARLRDVEDREVDDAMVMRVVTATPATPIAEVSALMLSHQLESIPLVDDQGKLVGVVTALDLVRWYSGR